MKEENLEEKKDKAHELIIFQAHEVYKVFVKKLTLHTLVIRPTGGDRERESRERHRYRDTVSYI